MIARITIIVIDTIIVEFPFLAKVILILIHTAFSFFVQVAVKVVFVEVVAYAERCTDQVHVFTSY